MVTRPPSRSRSLLERARGRAGAIGTQERLALQYAMARAFAEAEGLDDVGPLLFEPLTRTLGWESASLWVLAADDATLRCAAVWPTQGPLEPWAEHTLSFRPPIGVGLPGRVWESGQSLWISDTDLEDNFPRKAVAHGLRLRHGFAFPIRAHGSVAAVIELFARDVRELDAEQAKVLEAVGHQLGSFLERVEFRRAVTESEARKAAVLKAAVDAIVVADAQGRIVDFNPAAEALFGRTRAEVMGRRIVDVLVPVQLREQHEAGLTRYRTTRESRIIGHRVRTWAAHANGSEVPVELTVTDFRIDGDPMFTAFIRDITAERQSETARDRFLEILSHELRTPVTSIYGGATLASRGAMEREEQAGLLADIAFEADRLYRLVEDLIVLARAERGVAAVALEPISLGRVVERVVASVATRWPDVEFRVLSSHDGLPVQGDPTSVEQALRNLVSNAAKYGRTGGLIEVQVEHGDLESTVRVMDRGPGVDEAELSRLFEIDYRSPLTQALPGSGIGLFVARWLVEAMGGRIWGAPRAGGGAEFGFSLPTLHDDALEQTGVEAGDSVAVIDLQLPARSAAASLRLEPEG